MGVCWNCEYAEEHDYGEDGTELFCRKKHGWVTENGDCQFWEHAEILACERRAQKQDSKKWISVDDFLPDDGQVVLCMDEFRNYHIGCGWNDKAIATEAPTLGDIKWWMPLPHGPKEE